MQRYKQPSFDVHPDGEWIRYEDHCEAMKRIAGEAERCKCCGYLVTESEHRGCLRAAAPSANGQQAEPVAEVQGSDMVIGRERRNLQWMKGIDPFTFAPGTKLFAAPAPIASPAAQWEDHRVQKVYEILCRDDAPPPGEHWEGFQARLIVDAICGASPAALTEAELRAEFEYQHKGRNLKQHRLRGTYVSAPIAALWNQHKRTAIWMQSRAMAAEAVSASPADQVDSKENEK